ncbi:Type I Polyketide synthases (Type I PKS) [Aspergillus tanneri]|uniref:Type I Polyketide synthases (Type I PKS) n=1 Tax=Aspergillus tanneri TaxID=1220188 RepID=A0A5M9MT17_9EURO|nr:Type I Polyketide synthases (Type I PKS) [Aspergillus tanneri]KAA8650215.1 Type I Polyketide synthases (Type I PKS) [Aspergillus tanneri]
MHMLSPGGISHTFDNRANGYGRGDSIGAMVVKRLSDAMRDGDIIRAVIRGSSVNADGKTPSVTQPSSTAQAELINQTYKDAGLDLSKTGLPPLLAQRHTHLEHKTFAIANSLSELTERLTKGLLAATRLQRYDNNLVIVFTGQGAQWPAMGHELFVNPIFRASINVSQSYLEAFGCKWNAIEELTKITNPNVNRPEYSQPLCAVIHVTLVDLLRFWKVLPRATIGHSSGEIAAAYAASLLTHHNTIKLAYVRGVSSAAVSKQAGSAVVACINSPSSVTLSGDVDATDQLEALISSNSKFARKLKVTTAYHSPHMREVSPNYLKITGEITPKEADETENSPVMYLSLTGSIISSAKELNAQYWVNNMQNTVKFSQGFLALLKHKKVAPGGTRPVAVQWGGFLEVSPHAALQGPVRQIIDASNSKFAKSGPYTSMLVRGKDATETALNAAGVLWAAGCKVDMAAVNQQASTGSNTP